MRNIDVLKLEVMTAGYAAGEINPNVNLVPNTSFEADLSGWTLLNGDPINTIYRQSGGSDGSWYCAARNIDAGITDRGTITTPTGVDGMKVEANTAYIASLHYHVMHSGETGGRMTLHFYDNDGELIESYSPGAQGYTSSNWTNRLVINVVSPPYSAYASIEAEGSIDQVEMYRSYNTTQLVRNPGFDDDFDGWFYEDPGISTTWAEIVVDDFDGKCLHLHNINEFWSENIDVVAGKTYCFEFDVNSAESFNVYAYWYNSAGTSIATGNGAIAGSASTDWEHRQVTFDAPSGAAYVKYQFSSLTQSTTDNYFDNITITQIDLVPTYDESTLSNMLPNPDGAKGAWGWISSGVSNITAHKNAQGPYLRLGTPNSDTIGFESEMVRVTGKYMGGRIQVVSLSSATVTCNAVIYYYDINQDYISRSTWGTASGVGLFRLNSSPVPSNAVYASMYINLAHLPSGGGWMNIRDVMLAQSDKRADVGSGLVYAEYGVWEDILGPTHEISISRHDLDVGILSATVLDESLDPNTSSKIRPGRSVRLRALINSNWENLYEGTLTNALVSYGPEGDTDKLNIQIEAADNIRTLSTQSEPRGVEKIASLPFILEGKGAPWNVNGSGNQVQSATVVSNNDNASVLDQVAVTRDTALGYAWVDRFNVLQVWDARKMPTTVQAEFSDAKVLSYSDIDANFNTQSCINDVSVTFLRYDPSNGQTDEVTYGPYRDIDSITQWGPFAATFTIQGSVESPSKIAQYAGAILQANSEPVIRVNSLQTPIKDETMLGVANLDLYDRVGVLYKNKIGRRQRVTGITHNITPDKWTMKLDFEELGSVAAPQLVPSPHREGGNDVTRMKALNLESNRDANTSAGNIPALKVGPRDKYHLRIDGNEIIAMSDDSTQSGLNLNLGGQTSLYRLRQNETVVWYGQASATTTLDNSNTGMGTSKSIPGCSLSVYSPGPSAVFAVDGGFDALNGGVLTDFCVGRLVIDGSAYSQYAQIILSLSVNGRSTAGNQWLVTGLSEGNHTISLSAYISGADSGSAWSIYSKHTTIRVYRLTA